MQLGTIGSYYFVTVAKLKILVYLKPQKKKDKSHFENRGKPPDMVVITEKYSNFLHSGRVNSMVQTYVDTQGYICILQE